MLIDALDGVVDEGVAFHLFLCALEDEIDFLLVLARRVVLSTNRLLVSRYLLPRFSGFSWRKILLLLLGESLSVAEAFCLFLFEGLSPWSLEDSAILWQGSLVGSDDAVVRGVEVILQSSLGLAHDLR